MAKAARRLTDKHRDSVWVDADGDLWVYDDGNCWWRLMTDGGFPGFGPGGEHTPVVAYGPYVRVYKKPNQPKGGNQ